METISFSKTQCNTFLSLLAGQCEQPEKIFKFVPDEELGTKVVFNSIFKPIHEKCPFQVPKDFATIYIPSPRKGQKNKPSREKYPELWKASLLSDINTETLKYTLKRWHSQLCGVINKEGDKYTYIAPNAKGTKRYQTKQYWRIHDFCKQADAFYKGVYFVTLTTARDEENFSTFNNWKRFAEERKRFVKALKRRFACVTVDVMEAHLDGNPHAHMIIYMKNFLGDEKERYSRQQKAKYVCSGKLKEFINKHWTLGFNQIQLNKREGTANYLSKYIAKSASNDLFKLLKKETWSKSDRKMVLTILMPIVTGTRGFHFSEKVADKQAEELENECPASEKQERVMDDFNILPIEEFKALSDSERSSYLIKLSTKLHMTCKSHVRFVRNSSLEGAEWDLEHINETLSQEKLEKLYSNSHFVGCNGCIISRYIEQLQQEHVKLSFDNWKSPYDFSYLFTKEEKATFTASNMLYGLPVSTRDAWKKSDYYKCPSEYINYI